MSLSAILPVKSLAEVKSRLGPALSPGARSALAVEMLAQAVAAVTDSGAVLHCAIVSPDPHVLTLAHTLGAQPLWQRRGGLNQALDQGRGWAGERESAEILVLLPDLPLLTPGEVAGLAALAETDTVVLAPDRHGSGTNGLLVETAAPFRFQFGAGSLRRHIQEAERLGLTVRRFNSTGTQFDIDTPLDLLQWRALDEEARIA